jgi:hypothetical protein
VALTHRIRDYWMRKYSVILDDHHLPRGIEVVLTFGLRGSFAFFCQLAPLMDRVIESIGLTDRREGTTTPRQSWWRKLLGIGPARATTG